MADEYIRKQDVLNLPQSIERNLRGEIVERSIDVKDVEALKPADVAPVVHAHWKDNKNGTVSCSRCSTWFQKEREPYLRFCGYCGAKMDGERKE